MIELSQDNLSELLGQHKHVIVQYGATWCGNCRMVKPKFEKLAGEHNDIQFVYVDAEKFLNSRRLVEVNNLPTFAAFSEGKLLKQVQGNRIELVSDLVSELKSTGTPS